MGLVDGLYAVYRSLQSHKMSGLTVIGDKPAAAATQGVPPTQLYYCDHIFCKKNKMQKVEQTVQNNHIYPGGAATSDVTQLYLFSHIFCKKKEMLKISI